MASKLTDDEVKTLGELQKRQKEAEEEEKRLHEETKKKEEEARKAAAGGELKKAEDKKDEAEIARAGESTMQAILETNRDMLNLLEEIFRADGVPQKEIDDAKKRRRIVKT
jgi:membrane protein involved in colicin uptake